MGTGSTLRAVVFLGKEAARVYARLHRRLKSRRMASRCISTCNRQVESPCGPRKRNEGVNDAKKKNERTRVESARTGCCAEGRAKERQIEDDEKR